MKRKGMKTSGVEIIPHQPPLHGLFTLFKHRVYAFAYLSMAIIKPYYINLVPNFISIRLKQAMDAMKR